jgi:DNA polymerase III delta prime subunit/RNA binding exosome subunit
MIPLKFDIPTMMRSMIRSLEEQTREDLALLELIHVLTNRDNEKGRLTLSDLKRMGAWSEYEEFLRAQLEEFHRMDLTTKAVPTDDEPTRIYNRFDPQLQALKSNALVRIKAKANDWWEDQTSIPRSKQQSKIEENIGSAHGHIVIETEKKPAEQPTPIRVPPMVKAEKERTETKYPIILLGHDDRGKEVFWKPFEETNQHMLVCGTSGIGKTQTLIAIVKELEKEGISSVILDFKGGTFKLGHEIDVSNVTVNPLELDLGGGRDKNLLKNNSMSLAYALKGIFKLGEVQRGTLYEAFKKSYETKGISNKDQRTWTRPPPSFDDVKRILENMADDPRKKATDVSKLISKLDQIFETEYFSGPTTLPLSKMVSEVTTVSFDKMGGEEETKNTIAEVILRKLLAHMYGAGKSDRPRFFVVVDEGHRLGYERSALRRLAREAREYGVGLIVASQFMKDFPKVVLGNIATIISYCMEPSQEARYVAEQLGSQITKDHLLNLKKFHGYVRMGRAPEPQRFEFIPFYDERRKMQ